MSGNKHKILLTGGGTGGSVAPLLAMAEELKNNPPNPPYQGGSYEFLWLGGKQGPERAMAQAAGIKFKAIVGGKWRRYFSLKNLWDLALIKIGFWQAFFIMLKWRPDLVLAAGSFLSVPVVWAAWLLRVPVIVHQQDIIAGLANKLMAPFARVVTVTFESSLKDFGQKAVWIGNPTRQSREFPISNFQFPNRYMEMPTVLILGGGTGARVINELVEKSLDELMKFCQVIHVTGKEKGVKLEVRSKNYQVYEFLDADQMAAAMQTADLVITRAGLSTLSELSYLGKPSIIIPMPDTHQEANAAFFRNRRAAVTVKQRYLTSENFVPMVKDLLNDKTRLKQLAASMKQAMKAGANQAMVKIIRQTI